MSDELELNSDTSSPDHASDEDDLKALGLHDSDLDRFALYFELAFQGNSQSVTILVALLQRLCNVEKLRQQKHSGIWIEDIVGRFRHRLYTRCEPGFEAAVRFGNEASGLADGIFAKPSPVRNELQAPLLADRSN